MGLSAEEIVDLGRELREAQVDLMHNPSNDLLSQVDEIEARFDKAIAEFFATRQTRTIRSRERLIDVLLSVNWMAPGVDMFDAGALNQAGEYLRDGVPVLFRDWLEAISKESPSPHLRELATETLHYLNAASTAEGPS